MEQTEVKKRSWAPLIAVLSAIVVVGILVGLYCGACKWVRDNGCLLPNTIATDATGTVVVDLSKMTRNDAAAVMRERMGEHLAQRGVTIHYDGGSEYLSGTLLSVDPVSPVDYGMAYKSYQPFLQLAAIWFGLVEEPIELSLNAAVLTPTGAEEAERIAAEIAQKVYIEPVDYRCEMDEGGEHVLATHSVDGRMLDAQALAKELKQALLEGRKELTAEYISVPANDITAQMIYDLVYMPPVDPYLLEDGSLSLPQPGVSIDVESAQALLDVVDAGDTCIIPLVYTDPDFSTCQDLLYQDVLAENVSPLDGNLERSFNVRRAAELCNEVVIMPGEMFSYLGTVWNDEVKNTYMMGTGYENGLTVDMYGGGICQVSSAIYYCTVYSNLEIVWRANHAFLVTYVPKGLDATVYNPTLDYRFRNNTPYPIKIVTSSEKSDWGKVTVKILGTKQDDTYVEPEINLISTTPWNATYKFDEKIAPGSYKVEVTPYTGYVVEVYRCVYDGEGNLVSRTYENRSKYAKRDRVVLINPADAEKYGLNADGTPQYKYVLTVNWVDEEGNQLAPTESAAQKTGIAYTAQEKEFEGYTFLKSTGDNASGVMTANRTVTMIYTKTAEENPTPDTGAVTEE